MPCARNTSAIASISLKLTRNDIGPALSRLAATAKNPTVGFRSMDTILMSLTIGNFKGADYHPAPWPPRRDATPGKLQSLFDVRFVLLVGFTSQTGRAIAPPPPSVPYPPLYPLYTPSIPPVSPLYSNTGGIEEVYRGYRGGYGDGLGLKSGGADNRFRGSGRATSLAGRRVRGLAVAIQKQSPVE